MKTKNINELINISKNYSLLKNVLIIDECKKIIIDLIKYILNCAKEDFWKNKLMFG